MGVEGKGRTSVRKRGGGDAGTRCRERFAEATRFDWPPLHGWQH
jgi:hypothetical protein